jgi:Cu/Ag efflux protein CusF
LLLEFSKVTVLEVQMKRFSMIFLVMFCLTMSAFAAQTKTPPAGKKQFVFKGKVEKVDPTNKTLFVKSEKVEGWMDSMSMSYAPDKEDALKKVKAGDEITAKVYDGDYRTLYDIQVVTKPAEAAKPDQKAGKK